MGWAGRPRQLQDGASRAGVGQDTQETERPGLVGNRSVGGGSPGPSSRRTWEEQEARRVPGFGLGGVSWREVPASGAIQEGAPNTSPTPGSPTFTLTERTAPGPRAMQEGPRPLLEEVTFGSSGLRTKRLSVNFTVNFKVLKKGAVERVPSP